MFTTVTAIFTVLHERLYLVWPGLVSAFLISQKYTISHQQLLYTFRTIANNSTPMHYLSVHYKSLTPSNFPLIVIIIDFPITTRLLAFPLYKSLGPTIPTDVPVKCHTQGTTYLSGHFLDIHICTISKRDQ